MTVAAKSLTKGVTTAVRIPASTPMVPAADLRVMVDALGRLGYDRGVLVDAIGLSAAADDDLDAVLPCAAYDRLIACAQRLRHTPNIALHMAMAVPIGAYRLLDYLVLTSESVGAGLAQLQKYSRLLSNPLAFHTRPDSDPPRVELEGPAIPFAAEYTVALTALHLRHETDGQFTALRAALSHRPDDPAEFERVLRCPMEVGASWNGLSVARTMWELPLRRRDPVLRQVLEQQANSIVGQQSSRTGLAEQVWRVLTSRHFADDLRMDAVARELAMSARTLQRRLAAEGVSYQQLMDDWRKRAARQHLTGTSLALSEVAYLLGYSEVAAFHRAFKRWFGVTPHEFRRQRTN